MPKRTWIAFAAAAGLAGAAAWACGPMFPNQLLDHRGATLKAVPENSFAFEAQHLLPATDSLVSVEPPSYDYGAAKKSDANEAKALGVTVAQFARIEALRALANGDDAYAQGKDLPEDLRLYTAGAVDFTKGDFDKAATRFGQVLALPADQSKLRAVWAAYMLGRIHAAKAHDAATDAAAFSSERAAAAKAFELARARAVQGASDTQGLAVASFGEQARLWLYDHGRQCTWADLRGMTSGAADGDADSRTGPSATACGAGLSADDLKQAVTLYAAQAGHRSSGAVDSLADVAGFVMRQPDLMEPLIASPLPQRLLVAYALARMGDQSDAALARIDGSAGGAPANTDKPPTAGDPRLAALVQAIDQHGLDHVAGADRLASLAYETGNYGLAAKLVDKSSGPLSEWVRAKLALQRGDLAAANAAYAAAAQAFPKAGDPQPAIEPGNVPLIAGEHGVLVLARGEYVDALGHLYDAARTVGGDGNTYDWDNGLGNVGYGNDAVYVAERVLTVDELKAFVDARAPATPVPAKIPGADEMYLHRPDIADILRWVLARRLMRVGRYDEALPYFPAADDWRFGSYDDNGKLELRGFRAWASAYAQALRDSRRAWTGIGKAQALYAAAVIARGHGMEILGYQQDPDYADSAGAYQGGSGQTAQSLKQPYVTAGERQRFAASVARPDYRFHYRYIAAAQAAQAADLLPPRSQAFAAVLCMATRWMLQGPPDYRDNYAGYGEPAPQGTPERLRLARAYYARYVQQGAYVAWAADFGERCEAPDFDRARALRRTEEVRAVKHAVRRWMPLELGAFALALAGFAAWFLRRRRRP